MKIAINSGARSGIIKFDTVFPKLSPNLSDKYPLLNPGINPESSAAKPKPLAPITVPASGNPLFRFVLPGMSSEVVVVVVVVVRVVLPPPPDPPPEVLLRPPPRSLKTKCMVLSFCIL